MNNIARRMVTVAALASAPFALLGTAHAADTPATDVQSAVTADDIGEVDLVEGLTDNLLGEERGSREDGVDADIDLLNGDEVADIDAENDGREATDIERH
ncbi:hypothetical protein [Streptomyces sp. NPDC058304]|uniref:hypothetical protein n=1 Tax=Streptomyces sp. NPDC058304 TaxID=3346437 RepID=UPI0036E84030